MRLTKLYAILIVVLALALAGCADGTGLNRLTQRSRGATPEVYPTATAAPSQAIVPGDTASSPATAVPTATTVPPTSVAPTAVPPTSTPATSAAPAKPTSTDAINRAIKDVIQRANDEQVEAFTKSDPSPMRDTATADYYAKLVDTNQSLADSGVQTIKLVKLEWGPITLQGTTGAEPTTFETWSTTYNDGTNDQSRDRNVYTLVLESGAWKIKDDAHPDDGLDVPSGDVSPASPGQSPAPAPAPAALGAGESRNWSGYVATNGKFTGVSGTWVVPQPSSGRTGASDATWVGIGGARNHDLIQAGTETTMVGASQVRYNAWIETLPQVSHPVPLKVNPGDSVTVSLTQQGTDTWLITIKNNTTGQSYQTTKQYTSSLSSAEWIEEAPSGGRRVVPLDNFGTIPFTAATATVNGKSETAAQAGAKAVKMIDSTGQVIAAPSTLGKDGSSFSVTRRGQTPSTQPSPAGIRNPFIPANLLKSSPPGIGDSIGLADLP